MPEEEPRHTPRSYKALVLLFLQGGADTFNMLMPAPACESLYGEYKEVRQDIALTPEEMLEISVEDQPEQPCTEFGVHKELPFVAELFKADDLSFVANVGNMKARIHLGGCLGMFSHSNQVNGAQTGQCQLYTNDPGAGIGGRIADALATGPHSFTVDAFSLQGQAVWPRGAEVKRTILSEKASAFGEYDKWREAIHNITKHRYGNPYADAYAEALIGGLGTVDKFAALLADVQLITPYPTTAGLNSRMRAIAKVIHTREARSVERDLFYVEYGSFDHHGEVKAGLVERFDVVSEALRNFVLEVKELGVWDMVTIYTVSEFGRTLGSNGGGSDHGWSGHQIVTGGSVKGGHIFHTYPDTLLLDSPKDFGQGRLIPDFPWESFLIPLARWMDVSADAVETVFPNVVNFVNTSGFIATEEMFPAWVELDPPPV